MADEEDTRHIPITGMRQCQNGAAAGLSRSIKMLKAFQATEQALMQPGITVDSWQAERLHPIAHIGAHRIPHQPAGNVFRAHHSR